jgi:hypothetical protein
VWWHTPLIPALRRLKQEDHMFHSSMDYALIYRPAWTHSEKLKKTKQNKKWDKRSYLVIA